MNRKAHQQKIDIMHAQFNAKFVTSEMRKDDDGKDVTFEVASTAHPKDCPKCKLRTLYPCTWMTDIASKHRVLTLSCVRCGEVVFQGYDANGGDVVDLGRRSINEVRP